MDMGANYTPDEWEAWKAKQRAAHANGNGHGASLTQEAISLLPTPTATDTGKHAGQPRHKREGHQPRIADVIEYLDQWIGAATHPPSTDGSVSSDEEHQPPLFPAAMGDHDSPPASSSG
jgi:hypothetical protein